MTDNNLVQVTDLKMYFPIERGFSKKIIGTVKAVDNVNLRIGKGETLGLVGESGCGKTTLGRCIIKALTPTAGQIAFNSQSQGQLDVAPLSSKEMGAMRREMQMIFQDPYSSLDARMTVFDCISEPLKLNKLASGTALKDRVEHFANLVGLNIKHLNRYPHAFSGGQRQRIGIARALITNPQFIVADEPVSALDVSIQAQILNLLQDIQSEFRLTFLFISHDLRVIHYICDRVAVMYVGKIVEMADTGALYQKAMHPYTKALLSAIPIPDPRNKTPHITLPGEVANPMNPPGGCYFHPRCSHCKELCTRQEPALRELEPGHFCACHFAEELERCNT